MFTNDPKEMERVVAWREAAIADGWSCRATYEGHEAMERAATLDHPWGYHAMILSRDNAGKSPGKFRYEVGVYLWDALKFGIAIKTPRVYSLEAIQRAERTCPECGNEYESKAVMRRVAFANRCCANCYGALKAKLETRGWCD